MMPTQPTSQLSCQKLYDDIIARLQLMANEEVRIRDQPNEAIFLDDMLLRLKMWCKYVGVDSLKWADKIPSVGVQLAELLLQLNEAIQNFDDDVRPVIGQESQDIARSRAVLAACMAFTELGDQVPEDQKQRQLQDAVEKLTSYTSPLKAISSIPESERTNVSSDKINTGVTRQQSDLLSRNAPKAFILTTAEHAPENVVKELLGAIVRDPKYPFQDYITANEEVLMETFGSRHEWMTKVTKENFSMSSESSKFAKSMATATIPIHLASGATPDAIGPVSVGASFTKSSTSRESFGPVKMNRYSMREPRRYIENLLKRDRDLLERSKGSPMYVAVQVITVGDDDMLFAVNYRKVTWKRKFPWSRPQQKIEEVDRLTTHLR